MMKKGIIGTMIIAVVTVIWFSKIFSFFETDQYNERVETSNKIVYILNELQSKINSSQLYLENFAKIKELTESQQRGSWELLKLLDVDFEQDIQKARTRLSELNVNQNELEKELILTAEAVAESYQGYDKVYQRLVKQLLDKALSPENINDSLAIGLYEFQIGTEDAHSQFEQAQRLFLNK